MITNSLEQMEDLKTEVLSEDDLATLHEMYQTEMSIAKVRQAARQVKPKGFEGFCDCGNEIPEKRIELCLYNCVECQTAEEAKNKQRGRY